MTLDVNRHLHDVRQLKRLRQLRERAALNALRKAQALVAETEQAVQIRQQAVARLQDEREALNQRIVHECAAALGRVAIYATAAQERLDDQLERTEYALIDEEETLAEARYQAEQARQAWLRAVSQSGSVDSLVDDARHAVTRDREVRLEREDQPAGISMM